MCVTILVISAGGSLIITLVGVVAVGVVVLLGATFSLILVRGG